MRQLSFAFGLVILTFCVACGSGSKSPIFVPKGNFSNASLSGQYVYQISGFDFRNNGKGCHIGKLACLSPMATATLPAERTIFLRAARACRQPRLLGSTPSTTTARDKLF